METDCRGVHQIATRGEHEEAKQFGVQHGGGRGGILGTA